MTTADQTSIPRTEADERDLHRLSVLIALASAAIIVAALAGLVLGLANPEDGSTSDGVFRTAAAAGGLAAGALLGAAAVRAQVKNLWRFAPQWFRYLAWGVLAAVVVAALVSVGVRSD